MGFMQNQITDKQTWAEVDTNCGTEFVPIEQLGIKLPLHGDGDGIPRRCYADCLALLRDYIEGNKILDIVIREGYGARLSAPGYMDCTEWAVFDTEQEAIDYLEDTFGDGENDE